MSNWYRYMDEIPIQLHKSLMDISIHKRCQFRRWENSRPSPITQTESYVSSAKACSYMLLGSENVINDMILVNLYIRYHQLTLTGTSIFKVNGNVRGDGTLISKEWLYTHRCRWNCIRPWRLFGSCPFFALPATPKGRLMPWVYFLVLVSLRSIFPKRTIWQIK